MTRSATSILLLSGSLFLGPACVPAGPRADARPAPVQGGGIMNGTDHSTAPSPGPRPARPSLPGIVRLTIERVPFKPPSYRFVRSVYEGTTEALAFTIEADGALPLARDATPVLYVGDVELSDVEPLGEARYRFLAFAADEKAMRPDAPISLGWPGHKPHKQTRFWYAPPAP